MLSNRSPQRLWETALGQLELQVTRPNFETWLRHTVGLRFDDDSLVVGVPTDFALEWLRSRLASVINRTVSHIVGATTAVSLEVLGARAIATPPTPNGAKAAPAASAMPLDLDARLTFDSFVVVKSNRFAYRAARRVTAGELEYNPLLLVGPSGVGKTHLLQAIGNTAHQAGRAVVSLTAEAFVDRYAKAVRSGQPHTFRQAFDAPDVFLLDDFPFLTSRTASLEQFFHILNTLHRRDCSFVLAMDTRPDDLPTIPPRLASRLRAGLVAELHPPSPNERIDLLRHFASHRQPQLPEPILHMLAEQPSESVRDLEGSFRQVAAYAQLAAEPITTDLALQALHPRRRQHAHLSPHDVIQTVCSHYHISQDQLAGPSRARDITYPRHIAMYLLREHGSFSLADIGRLLGSRDHSTVLSGCNRIKQELQTLKQTKEDVKRLEQLLQRHSAA